MKDRLQSEVISCLINNYIRSNHKEPNIIIIHPSVFQKLKREFDTFFQHGVDHNELAKTGKLRFKGIKTIRSEDLEDGEIQVF